MKHHLINNKRTKNKFYYLKFLHNILPQIRSERRKLQNTFAQKHDQEIDLMIEIEKIAHQIKKKWKRRSVLCQPSGNYSMAIIKFHKKAYHPIVYSTDIIIIKLQKCD